MNTIIELPLELNDDKCISLLSKFFNWELWENGDFEGWQKVAINNALIRWYNIHCVDSKAYKPILDMDTFIKAIHLGSMYLNAKGITQSVMSFSMDEVVNNVFSDFNEDHPFARIGYADFGTDTTTPLRISMTRADCSNWIMTNFGGNNEKVALEIWYDSDKEERANIIKSVIEYILTKESMENKIEFLKML